jgi:hypothetical protein
MISRGCTDPFINTETLILEGNWLSGSLPTELSNLHNVGTSCNDFFNLTPISGLTFSVLSLAQMSFRRNYLSGNVAPEICELRNGALKELEVDSWVECDCCAS